MLIRLNEKRRSCDPALLRCEGTPSCGQWMKHDHVEIRRIIFQDQMRKDVQDIAYEEIYACARCNAKCRWGLLAMSSQKGH